MRMTSDPIQVTFDLREEDCRAWWQYWQERRWPSGVNYGIALVAMLCMFKLAQTYWLEWPASIGLGAAGLVCGYLASRSFPSLVANEAARSVFSGKKAKAQLGSHTLAADDEGIHEEAPYGSHQHRWSALEEFCETSDHFFVVVAGGHAYVVPKRAFATEATAREFWSAVQSLAQAK